MTDLNRARESRGAARDGHGAVLGRRAELPEAEQDQFDAADDLAGVFEQEAPVSRRERFDPQPFKVAPRGHTKRRADHERGEPVGTSHVQRAERGRDGTGPWWRLDAPPGAVARSPPLRGGRP